MSSPSLTQDTTSAGPVPLSSAASNTAVLPYSLPARSLTRSFSQYITVVRILFAEYRTNWFFQAFFGLFLPIGFIFFLKTAGNGVSPERAIFLLGGNLATSITFGPTCMLLMKIGAWKQNREFDYWAALPLGKLVVVFALLSVGFVFALPGLIGVYVFGSLMLGLPFTGGPLLIPIAFLSALSLIGFGAIIGSYVNDGQTASIVANLLIVMVGFLSPTLMPPEALPAPLRVFSTVMPTTYAADAFRQVLNGQFGMTLALDLLVLVLTSVVFLTWLSYKVDWRSN